MLLNVLVVDDLVVDIRRTICAVSYFFYQARPIAVVVATIIVTFLVIFIFARKLFEGGCAFSSSDGVVFVAVVVILSFLSA